MNLAEIENNIKNMIQIIQDNNKRFLYELLRCYGIPKSSITKLEKGNLNISKNQHEVLWKNKLFFKECTEANLYETFFFVLAKMKIFLKINLDL